MSMDPKARVFYGVRINTSTLPEEAEHIYEEQGSFEEALSFYLLKKHGYDPAEYGNEGELPKRTGIRVLALEHDGVYLAVDSTCYYQSTYGIQSFDMDTLDLDRAQILEIYAQKLGTKTALGTWFLAADFN